MSKEYIRVPYGSTVHGDEEVEAGRQVLGNRNALDSLLIVCRGRQVGRPGVRWPLRQQSRSLLLVQLFRTLLGELF